MNLVCFICRAEVCSPGRRWGCHIPHVWFFLVATIVYVFIWCPCDSFLSLTIFFFNWYPPLNEKNLSTPLILRQMYRTKSTYIVHFRCVHSLLHHQVFTIVRFLAALKPFHPFVHMLLRIKLQIYTLKRKTSQSFKQRRPFCRVHRDHKKTNHEDDGQRFRCARPIARNGR